VNVLVLGGGAREHALCVALAGSCAQLLCAPGNPGIAQVARCHPQVDPADPSAVLRLCAEARIALCVVGPEAPLVAGVADVLRAAGVAVFGPSRAAAQVEGSKSFAKALMREAGIPTADFAVFDSAADAASHARARGACVVKADGLAAGKGVVVAGSGAEAGAAVEHLASSLGAQAARFVIEDVLEGEEASVIALCDGERFALLPPAQDHKRLGDGDTGPNTGGMGAYTPAPILDDALLARVGAQVMGPALRTLAARGTPFRGALFAGLMIRKSPRGAADFSVLEFNARLGDPECQVLLPRVQGELLPWLHGAATGALPGLAIPLRSNAVLGVVLASAGYPQAPRSGDAISGLDAARQTGARIFHAGTALRDGALVTAGGRVLTVCGEGDSLQAARAQAERACQAIQFSGMQRRHDIGARALGR